jgi:pimeloyl-ACP methyl ester carboxylesterase
MLRGPSPAVEAVAEARRVQIANNRFAVLVVDAECGRGAVRTAWAATAAEAREAFHAGAQVVVCDVAAALRQFRPSEPVSAAEIGRPALVMLPGMLGDASVWDSVAERICDVVVPLPGRIDLDDSVAELAESVLASAPERFYLCAHSLGGIVALEMLRRSPGRIAGAVLANTSARAGSAGQLAVWARLRECAAAGEFATIAAELARSNLPPARRHDIGLVQRGERMAHAVGAAGFVRQLTAQMTRPESRGTLAAAARTPVVVVSGDQDHVCPPELQQELVDCLPAGRLVTISGAGHMLPLEDPDSLAHVIRGAVLAGAAVQ